MQEAEKKTDIVSEKQVDTPAEIISSPEKEIVAAPDGKKPERRDTRFQRGQSGNPSGRPKQTQEEKDALEMIKSLAPEAAEIMKTLLHSKKVSPALKVRICEIIFDRTYGRVESSVRFTSVKQSIEESRQYILALVENVRQEDDDGRRKLDAGE